MFARPRGKKVPKYTPPKTNMDAQNYVYRLCFGKALNMAILGINSLDFWSVSVAMQGVH